MLAKTMANIFYLILPILCIVLVIIYKYQSVRTIKL